MRSPRRGNAGLVLTGGGARAAYQVGAVQALAEISGPGRFPFPVLAGMSAGAINAVALAGGADDFSGSAARVAAIWARLTPNRVYRTDARKIATLGARWIGLPTPPKLGATTDSLLDTAPLRRLLTESLRVERHSQLLRSGVLHGLAVSATDYTTGTAVTFFDGDRSISSWTRTLRRGERTSLTVDHVLASAAIPLLFPPVRIGSDFYGDGCIRMLAPLSPAVHLGADRIVAISVRHRRSPHDRDAPRAASGGTLPLAGIAGNLMNALFLEALELDIERLERMNELLRLVPSARRSTSRFHEIPLLVLRPSQDLGELAAGVPLRMPVLVRRLLHGMGAGYHGTDLLSYLAFEPGYLRTLIRLGYRDTMARRDEIDAFLYRPALANGNAGCYSHA